MKEDVDVPGQDVARPQAELSFTSGVAEGTAATFDSGNPLRGACVRTVNCEGRDGVDREESMRWPPWRGGPTQEVEASAARILASFSGAIPCSAQRG